MAAIETNNLSTLRRWNLVRFDETAWIQGREYVATFATEFTLVASQILVYKLAAYFLGKEGFAEYLLARRTTSLIYPMALLGFGVALPRYLGYAAGRSNSARSVHYFGATLWSVGCALALCVTLMNLFQKWFAYVFFGGKRYADLVFPLSLLMIGLTLHALAYAYFRGHLAMKHANLLQFVNLGIVPVIAFCVFSRNVRSVLEALGVFSIAVSAIALLFTPWRGMASSCLAEAKELLRYGVQRVPGDFAQMALLSLPVTLIAHSRGVQAAGSLAFGVSILAAVGAAFSPVGLILLPKASRMLAEAARDELRQQVLNIIRVTVIVSIVSTIALEIFAGPLIRFYLGASFEEVVPVIRVVSIGVLPFGVYCALRGLIDAHYTRAVNAVNCALGLLVFLLCAGALRPFDGPDHTAEALLAGIFALGILTARETRKILAH